jgi:AcrR family transcriptional regulator
MEREPEGLRERKKRQTRETIAAAAMRLFKRRGFDAVTVAEIAAAADVSEKTVFNYFPSKEDLVLSEGPARRAAAIDAIRNRPPGTSLVQPFRELTMAYLDRVEHEPLESLVEIPRLVLASRALQQRLFVGWEEESAVLTPVIAEETGAAEGDLEPLVAARTLAWTHRLAFRAAFLRLLDGEDQREVAADLRRQANRAYDLLENGLAEYGTR